MVKSCSTHAGLILTFIESNTNSIHFGWIFLDAIFISLMHQVVMRLWRNDKLKCILPLVTYVVGMFCPLHLWTVQQKTKPKKYTKLYNKNSKTEIKISIRKPKWLPTNIKTSQTRSISFSWPEACFKHALIKHAHIRPAMFQTEETMATLLSNMTQNLSRDNTQINEVYEPYGNYPGNRVLINRPILAIKIQIGTRTFRRY